jgi:hypothetical protein
MFLNLNTPADNFAKGNTTRLSFFWTWKKKRRERIW